MTGLGLATPQNLSCKYSKYLVFPSQGWVRLKQGISLGRPGTLDSKMGSWNSLNWQQHMEPLWNSVKLHIRCTNESLWFWIDWVFFGASLVAQMVKNLPGFDLWVRKIPWKKEWQPIPIFLPGESHGQTASDVTSFRFWTLPSGWRMLCRSGWGLVPLFGVTWIQESTPWYSVAFSG